MPGRKLWTTIQLDANVVNNSFRFRQDCFQAMEINPLDYSPVIGLNDLDALSATMRTTRNLE